MSRNDNQVRCSFCNRTQAQVRKLIAGPEGVYICDECVDVCAEIIEEELAYTPDRQDGPFSDINLLKPEEIKAFLEYAKSYPKANGEPWSIACLTYYRKQEEELKKALEFAASYESSVLIEKHISGRELTQAILDGAALPPVEIIPRCGFYDYAKRKDAA